MKKYILLIALLAVVAIQTVRASCSYVRFVNYSTTDTFQLVVYNTAGSVIDYDTAFEVPNEGGFEIYAIDNHEIGKWFIRPAGVNGPWAQIWFTNYPTCTDIRMDFTNSTSYSLTVE